MHVVSVPWRLLVSSVCFLGTAALRTELEEATPLLQVSGRVTVDLSLRAEVVLTLLEDEGNASQRLNGSAPARPEESSAPAPEHRLEGPDEGLSSRAEVFLTLLEDKGNASQRSNGSAPAPPRESSASAPGIEIGDWRCVGRAVVLGVLGALVLLATASHIQHKSQVAPPHEALGVMLLASQFCALFSFSLPILDSLDLAKRIGRDMAFSGKAVGVYMTGMMFGGVALWVLLKWFPNMWKQQSKATLLFGLLMNVAGLLIYSVGILFSYHALLWRSAAWVLIAGRVVSGFGSGITSQLCHGLVARLWEQSRKPTQMASMMLMNQLAIGLGPVAAALTHGYAGPGDLLAVWSTAVAGLSVVAWAAMMQHVLPTSCTKVCFRAAPLDPALCRRVLGGCLVMTTCRAYAAASLEAVLALLLEAQFGWSLRSVGLSVGATFLACIVAAQTHQTLEQRLSTGSWIRVLAGVSVLGCVVLAMGTRASEPRLFLLGGAILFPSIYLADALAIGVMQQHLLPQGTWFADVNNATFYRNTLSNGIGRFLGPWLGRLIVQERGAEAYVVSQLAGSVCFILAFEQYVAPGVSAK